MLESSVDVAVIGAGAAGMVAAIRARSNGHRVLLLEAGEQPGRKILVSGNGRCNLTNLEADSCRHYHARSPRFVRRVLRQFPLSAALDFFRQLGVEPRQGTRGRLYPASYEARSVAEALLDRLAVCGVRLRTEMPVRDIRVSANGFDVHVDQGTCRCGAVILATGGPSASRLGADRSGIDLACRLGHRSTELLPGLVPLVSPDPLVRRMHGARVEACVQASIGQGECIEDRGELLFTRYGISGPVVLNLSARLVPVLRRSAQQLTVDLFPGRSPEELAEMLKSRWSANPHRSLARSFLGLLPQRVAAPLVESVGLPAHQQVKTVSKAQRWQLAQGLHAWEIPVTEPRSLEDAEVTIGGIATAGIDAETLQSRRIPGLFMAGEMLDVHGDLGGYNLHWAWASGWVAGGVRRD